MHYSWSRSRLLLLRPGQKNEIMISIQQATLLEELSYYLQAPHMGLQQTGVNAWRRCSIKQATTVIETRNCPSSPTNAKTHVRLRADRGNRKERLVDLSIWPGRPNYTQTHWAAKRFPYGTISWTDEHSTNYFEGSILLQCYATCKKKILQTTVCVCVVLALVGTTK